MIVGSVPLLDVVGGIILDNSGALLITLGLSNALWKLGGHGPVARHLDMMFFRVSFLLGLEVAG
jgi:hypothetical protein